MTSFDDKLFELFESMPVECRGKFGLDVMRLAEMAQREDYLDYELF